MGKSIRERLRALEAIKDHPHIMRFTGSVKPHLWIPKRRTVALAAGIGAAISMVPLPAQGLIAAFAAMRFQAHMPTAVAMTFLSNPITTLPLLGTSWTLGMWCLGEPVSWPDRQAWATSAEWLSWLRDAGEPLLVGIPLLAASLGLLSFGIVRLGWRLAIVRRWRRRTADRLMN